MITSLNTSVNNILCKNFGHRWKYKDYTNHIKETGEQYDFTASRYCTRCNQFSYYYNTWKDESKSRLDYQSEYFSMNRLKIDDKEYS